MLDRILDEGFGDLGESAEGVINAVSGGVQGVIKGYADAKENATSGVIQTAALSALALIVVPIVVWKALD